MDEIRARELDGTGEGATKAALLEQRHGNDEPDEREPGETGQHEHEREQGERQIGEDPRGEGTRRWPSPHGHAAHDPAGEEVRRGEHRRAGEREQIPVPARELGGDNVRQAGQHTEQKPSQEVVLVEADRLRDELPHRPRLGWERRWQRPPRRRLLRRSAPCHRAER